MDGWMSDGLYLLNPGIATTRFAVLKEGPLETHSMSSVNQDEDLPGWLRQSSLAPTAHPYADSAPSASRDINTRGRIIQPKVRSKQASLCVLVLSWHKLKLEPPKGLNMAQVEETESSLQLCLLRSTTACICICMSLLSQLLVPLSRPAVEGTS